MVRRRAVSERERICANWNGAFRPVSGFVLCSDRGCACAYEKANRPDLVAKERAEASILEAYLPKQMTESEVETEVRAIISEVGSRELSKIMPAALARLKGKAEGRMVNQAVTRVLAEG